MWTMFPEETQIPFIDKTLLLSPPGGGGATWFPPLRSHAKPEMDLRAGCEVSVSHAREKCGSRAGSVKSTVHFRALV